MLECVINVSEGRRADVVDALATAAGPTLLDVHADRDHHRAVLTLAGHPPDVEAASRAVARAAVAQIDLRAHLGAHPRLGAVDVVPFVPLASATIAEAVEVRDRFGAWAADDLGVPCFFYGPERSLPEVRRRAFASLPPDRGPARPHPTAGAIAVGARTLLVAYNVWLADPSVTRARHVAAAVRSPRVRALGLDVGGRAQVSMNLVDPAAWGPADAYDAVAALVGTAGIARAELVGLLPEAVLAAVPRSRWARLDLCSSRTIEARLQEAGLDGGSSVPHDPGGEDRTG